jgi:hypothetical protein
MLRRKLAALLFAGCLVVAASAMSASSASAAFTLTTKACTGGAFLGLCYENEKATECGEKSTVCELEGTSTETVSGGATTLKINTSPNVVVECKTASGSGTIDQLSPLTESAQILKGVIGYKGCKITAPAEIVTKCVIPETKETNLLLGTLTSVEKLLLKPETGTVFIEIPFTSKEGQTCPATVKGTRSVTGEQEVTIASPETFGSSKTGTAVLVSKLEFFSQKAELTEELTLTLAESISPDTWAIKGNL